MPRSVSSLPRLNLNSHNDGHNYFNVNCNNNCYNHSNHQSHDICHDNRYNNSNDNRRSVFFVHLEFAWTVPRPHQWCLCGL